MIYYQNTKGMTETRNIKGGNTCNNDKKIEQDIFKRDTFHDHNNETH